MWGCEVYGVPMRMKVYHFFVVGCFLLWPTLAPAQANKPAWQIEWDKTVEAANKEGRVVVSIPTSAELRKELATGFQQKFPGVELELNAARGSSNINKIVEEQNAGVPSIDLHMGGTTSIVTGLLAQNLLDPIMPKLLLPDVRDAKNWWGGHLWADSANKYIYGFTAYMTETVWYNSTLVKPEEITSYDQLLEPKWRGKIVMYPYTSTYLGYSFILSIDKTLSTLREIMKNAPVVDVYATGLTRYMSGEYPILLTASSFFWEAKRKGVPAQWVSPDISLNTIHASFVTKSARHPNAAKLVAVYLASPDGHKLMYEEAGAGSVFYPGNFEHDIDKEDRQLGLKVYHMQQVPGLLDYMLSEKGAPTEREIGQILKGQ